MKLFLINGAPRASGYTADIVRLFCQGASSAGATVDVADLRDLSVHPCRGCYRCWRPESPGKCVIRDDMANLIDRYLESDVIVFASPLYFYSFSALMKSFIDRLFAILCPKLEQGEGPKMVHHALRRPKQGPTRCALLVVSGHRDHAVLDGLRPTFSLIADALHIEWAGTLFRPESFFLDFGVSRETLIRKIEAAIEKAGQELVTEGRISQETFDTAALPISKSIENFCEQTAGFWNVASEGGHDISNRETLRAAVLKDLRIVMPAIADCFDSNIAGDLSAVINFDISNSAFGAWHFEIEKGCCRCSPSLHPTPTTTIKTALETWIGILKNQQDARVAISRKQLTIMGDMRLFMRFPRLFPGSS